MNTASELELLLQSPSATFEVGAMLGATAKGGELLVLSGELGSGKTMLVKGLAKGLECPDAREVRSPSYTLMNRHDGRCALLHFDVYFTRTPEDLRRNQWEEELAAGAVVALEWGERFQDALPADHLRVRLEHLTPTSRRLRACAGGSRSREWLERTQSAVALAWGRERNRGFLGSTPGGNEPEPRRSV